MKVNKLEVLKYLYNYDDGEYKDITKKFKYKNDSDYKKINLIIKELNDYIDIEENLIEIENRITVRNIPKIKINIDGQKYYQETKFKSLETKINFKNYIIGILMLIVATLTIFAPNIRQVFVKNIIPNITVRLQNGTDETQKIFYRSGITIWLPSSTGDGAPRYDGTAELLVNGDTLEIPAGNSIKVKAKILNENSFYKIFKNGDSDITINIRTNDGKLYISDWIPFSDNGFKKYYTSVIID